MYLLYYIGNIPNIGILPSKTLFCTLIRLANNEVYF